MAFDPWLFQPLEVRLRAVHNKHIAKDVADFILRSVEKEPIIVHSVVVYERSCVNRWWLQRSQCIASSFGC